jgi:hypothetical protein
MGLLSAKAAQAPWTRAALALGVDVTGAALLVNATLLLWLGLMHINTVVALLCLAWLPHPFAAAVLAVLSAAAFLPIDRPFSPWQERLAAHISATAHAYFPGAWRVARRRGRRGVGRAAAGAHDSCARCRRRAAARTTLRLTPARAAAAPQSRCTAKMRRRSRPRATSSCSVRLLRLGHAHASAAPCAPLTRA